MKITYIYAGAAVAGLAALWWFSRKAGGAFDAAGQALEQGAANVTSAWNNAGAPAPWSTAWGNSAQLTQAQVIYGDRGYTGNDPYTGQPVMDGEWFNDAVARQYDASNLGTYDGMQPVVSNNGAAFGIYPGTRRPADPSARDALLYTPAYYGN